MRRWWWGLVAAGWAACGDPGEGDDTDGGDTDASGTTTEPVDEAAVLADLVALLDAYGTWGQPPGWEGVVETPGALHGPYVEVFYDDTALASQADPVDGSTAFKRAFDADQTTLLSVTAMRKVPDYGWFYLELAPDESVLSSGRVEACLLCHESGISKGFLVQ